MGRLRISSIQQRAKPPYSFGHKQRLEYGRTFLSPCISGLPPATCTKSLMSRAWASRVEHTRSGDYCFTGAGSVFGGGRRSGWGVSTRAKGTAVKGLASNENSFIWRASLCKFQPKPCSTTPFDDPEASLGLAADFGLPLAPLRSLSGCKP